MACVALGTLLPRTADSEEMYHAPTNSPGGVRAQAEITSVTTAGTNTTVCWYGMQGWYTAEMSTNAGASWDAVGRTAASAHAACLTVDNGGSPSATFRLNQNNAFAGTGACSGCHGDKANKWAGTAHATAYDTIANMALPPAVKETCYVCHTVGKDQPTGFVNITNTPHLRDVGCESCHGPSAWHKYSDHDLVRPAVSIDPKICGGCHQGEHHPTFEEYETSPHAEVNDDIKYGFANGVYYSGTLTTPSNTWYGYYVTTNANGTLRTNATTGIIHSFYGPANNPIYDQGQDRAAGCGICHSAAARQVMLQDFEARLKGYTNALAMPAAHDAAEWSAACATCHDPHELKNPAQLRNPTRSTNYYTMPTATDKRTVLTTNFMGGITTNVYFYSAAFASLYDPNVQVCAQCHNSRGARWDGRSYGLSNGVVVLTTNVSFSRPPHHSPQYNLLIGIVQPDYLTTNALGVATNWLQRHGTSVSSSSGNYNTNQCATCHVVSGTDPISGHAETGHKFEVNFAGCTLSGCHGSVPNYEEVQHTTTNRLGQIVSLLNQWAVAKGTNLFGAANATKYKDNGWEFTTIGALASITNAGPSSSDQLKLPDAIKMARFNLYMVLHDGSLGIHNPRFASGLITDAETKVLSQFSLANFRAFTTTGFAPLTVGFTNLGTGVTGYDWNFGDGNTSTLATPTNVFASRGLYSVSLTATDGVSSETVTRPNYIGVYTRPTVTFAADTQTGFAPLTVNFTNTSANTIDVTAWRWTIAGQNITATNTSYTFTNAGTYNVALRASTPAGNITSTSNAFIVVTAPVP